MIVFRAEGSSCDRRHSENDLSRALVVTMTLMTRSLYRAFEL